MNIKTQKLNPEFYINYLKNIKAVSKEDEFIKLNKNSKFKNIPSSLSIILNIN